MTEAMISGGIVAGPLSTFDSAGRFDFTLYERIVDFLIESGVDAVVAAGYMIQNFTYLTLDERKEIIVRTQQFVGGRKPVVAGISGRTTNEALELLAFSESKGVQAVLSSAPYGNRVSASECLSYFQEISKRSSTPVFVYNHPDLGMDMPVSLLTELSKIKNIKYIKDVGFDVIKFARLVQETKDNTIIFGVSEIMLPCLVMGVEGISAPPPLVGLAKELMLAYHESDHKTALRLQRKILDYPQHLIKKRSDLVAREALRAFGLDTGFPRAPFDNLEPSEEKMIREFVGQIDRNHR